MNSEISRFVDDLREDLVNNRLDLPALPEITFKLRQEIDKPQSTVSSIAKLISSDASLSARVLRVANSPFFRGLSAMETVNDAVSRLGRNCIRNMVISLMMSDMYKSKHNYRIKKRLRGIWQKSTQVAATSQVLSGKYTELDPNQALLAGLIHNIGTLPILKRFNDYPDLYKDERVIDKLLEALHKEVGTYVLRRWDFPPEMVAIPIQHENFERTHKGPVDYVDVVMVSILHTRIGTPHPHAKLDWTQIAAFEKLDLTPEKSIESMQEAKDEIRDMQSLLN